MKHNMQHDLKVLLLKCNLTSLFRMHYITQSVGQQKNCHKTERNSQIYYAMHKMQAEVGKGK